VRSLSKVTGLVPLAVGLAGGNAMAANVLPPDPSQNFNVTAPSSCLQGGFESTQCLNDSVAELDQARASVGLPNYQLPANFNSLSPDKQELVLTDSDRVAYGLAPFTGITSQLDADATTGANSNSDPVPDSSLNGDFASWGSNWAGGFGNGNSNMLLSHALWVYDDGPGGPNLDCPSPGAPGCWGHRHNVLAPVSGSASSLAMGAAPQSTKGNQASFTGLYFQGNSNYSPTYTYTWQQAQQGGADHPSAAPASSHHESSLHAFTR
jgi:hypothetical protein